MNPVSTPTFDDAIRTLSSWYMDEVRALATEAAKLPEEERYDWIHEAVDGHEYIIYTFKARCVLVATDNPEAYEEELGEKPPTVEAAACMAMISDVTDLAESYANPEGWRK
jgi:hypothetical protein